MCVVDSTNKEIIYGDSLAWPAPMNLQMKVGQHLKADDGHNVSTSKLKYCHELSSCKAHRTSCSETRSKIVPATELRQHLQCSGSSHTNDFF